MNIYPLLSIVCITTFATTSLAQDHPDHPSPKPIVPLEKPTQVEQADEEPAPPTPLFIDSLKATLG